jgi:hypothetical protein
MSGIENTVLRYANIGTALWHSCAGALLLWLSASDWTVPVITTYVTDGTRASLATVQSRGSTAVGLYSGWFLLVCSVDHLLVGTLYHERYTAYLRLGVNPFRWAEYAISASIMHVQIAQLSGIQDLHILVALGGLTVATMLCGYWQEHEAMLRRQCAWPASLLPFYLGCIPHLIGWGIILSYFGHAVVSGSPPDFVYAIIVCLFVLDGSFAVNQWLQQKGIGRWRSYLFAEYGYIVLSLVSKTLLAWMTYGGARSL